MGRFAHGSARGQVGVRRGAGHHGADSAHRPAPTSVSQRKRMVGSGRRTASAGARVRHLLPETRSPVAEPNL